MTLRDLRRVSSELSVRCVRGLTMLTAPICAFGCVVVCTAEFSVAAAQESAAVDTSLVAEVREEVTLTPGRVVRRYVPANVLHQGQEVFYTVRIRNPGPESNRSVEVVQQIPENTLYVPLSASGPDTQIAFSVDGLSFGAENQLDIVDSTGATRRARPEEYRYIRWRLHNALASGAVALARFRATFN
jgi:uncharacterized repeat protein (TIGR01451 family)